MAWRKVTEQDLVSALSLAETEAFRKSADFAGDPVEKQLASAVAHVRGMIRSGSGRVKMSPDPLALPESLIVPAMDYLRFHILARMNVAVNESRTKAYDDALELFVALRRGEFVPEPDGDENDQATDKAVSPAAADADPPRLLD